MALTTTARGIKVSDGKPVAFYRSPDKVQWEAVDSNFTAIDTVLATLISGVDAVEADVAAIEDSSGRGALPEAAKHTVTDSTAAAVYKTVFTLDELTVSVTAGNNTAYGSVCLYDFPKGALAIRGATIDLLLANPTEDSPMADGADGDFHIGTTAQTDVAIGNIVATEHDIVPTSTLALTADYALLQDQSGDVAAPLDGTSTAKKAYLNLLFDGADVTDDVEITLTGTITLFWSNLGTYSQALPE